MAQQTLLHDFGRLLRTAKDHIFRMQDIADAIDDRELKRRCQETRDWIESADRRATELQHNKGPESHGARRTA